MEETAPMRKRDFVPRLGQGLLESGTVDMTCPYCGEVMIDISAYAIDSFCPTCGARWGMVRSDGTIASFLDFSPPTKKIPLGNKKARERVLKRKYARRGYFWRFYAD